MVPISLVPARPAQLAPPRPSRARPAPAAPTASSPTSARPPSRSTRARLTTTLIETNAGVARSMASRYRNRGIDLDDLEQVALLGLTKAAQRFDPGAGHDFLSYAVPTIRGELRRHFRDSGWMVRPPRRVQDLQSRISRAQDDLESTARSLAAAHRGRRPTSASPRRRRRGPHGRRLLHARRRSTGRSVTARRPSATSSASRTAPPWPPRPGSSSSPSCEAALARDRRILRLRFVDERTQQEIAEEIGLTQAQVSRVLTRILAGLRADLAGRAARRLTDSPRRCNAGLLLVPTRYLHRGCGPTNPALQVHSASQESKPRPAASSARRNTCGDRRVVGPVERPAGEVDPGGRERLGLPDLVVERRSRGGS